MSKTFKILSIENDDQYKIEETNTTVVELLKSEADLETEKSMLEQEINDIQVRTTKDIEYVQSRIIEIDEILDLIKKNKIEEEQEKEKDK